MTIKTTNTEGSQITATEGQVVIVGTGRAEESTLRSEGRISIIAANFEYGTVNTVETLGDASIAATIGLGKAVAKGSESIAAQYAGSCETIGHSSIAAATGEHSRATSKTLAATAGNKTTAIANSDFSVAVARGDGCKSQSKGDYSISIAAMHNDFESVCSAEADGEGSIAITNTQDGKATSKNGLAIATGETAIARAWGNFSVAIATNYGGTAFIDSIKGDKPSTGLAISSGNYGRAGGPNGSWIVLAQRDQKGAIIAIKSAQIGTCGLKPNTYYELDSDGHFVRV